MLIIMPFPKHVGREQVGSETPPGRADGRGQTILFREPTPFHRDLRFGRQQRRDGFPKHPDRYVLSPLLIPFTLPHSKILTDTLSCYPYGSILTEIYRIVSQKALESSNTDIKPQGGQTVNIIPPTDSANQANSGKCC